MHLSTSSGVKSASAQISVMPGAFAGIDATPPNAGYTNIVVYDSENSSVSGKLVLAEIHLDAGHISVNHEYMLPVAVNRGIYCVMTSTGTGSTYVARYLAG